MLFRNPRQKLDAKLRARIEMLEEGHRGQRLVRVTVECRKGAEETVAAAVRREGGTVFDVIPAFHLVAAEVPVTCLMDLARSRRVREVNLAGKYVPA
jgi:hypothetical protein